MPALVAGIMRAFCGPRATRRRTHSQAALRAGISAEDAALEVLLGCCPLCAGFSEFALTKAIVVALPGSARTRQQLWLQQNLYIDQYVI
jgi:hypothetical protein